MKTDRLTPPPSRQRQEDFQCPPGSDAADTFRGPNEDARTTPSQRGTR